MTRKQWACLSLAMILGALSLIVGAVVFIDPFEVYHKATRFIPPIISGTQSYSNAGIAKSYDYDSIIIGSSMTENFTPSQMDALLGGRFVKLCVNGGTPFNHKQMMDMAFSAREIKTVFYGLDAEALTFFYKTPKAEMPTYLYDDDLFNDTQYWFNKSVLAKYIPACLRTWGQSDPHQRDTMYSWGDTFAYGKDAVLKDVKITDKTVAQEEISKDPVLSQQSMLNIEHNLIPFIEAHPETEFIIFFPPYSLARWFQYYARGTMNAHLNQKEAVIKRLLPYDNVRIYDYHAQTEWITNLDHYVDTEHYGPHINREIIERISRGENRITELSQSMANDDIIRALVEHVRAAGRWPDAFPEAL